jgi:hypothetical protein
MRRRSRPSPRIAAWTPGALVACSAAGLDWIVMKALEKDQTLSGIDDRVSEDIAERAKRRR